MHRSSYLGLSCALFAIFAAPTAWAATPQEILNNDLAAFNTRDGYHVNGQFTINVDESLLASAPASAKQGPQKTTATFDFKSRALPRQDDKQDSEGSFALTKASMQTDGQTYALTDPMSLEWISVQPNVFWRLGQVPGVLLDYLKPYVDVSPLVGRWIKADAEAKDSSFSLLPQLGQTENLKTQTEAWASKKYFLITRTEKKYKNALNEDMARVRVTVNRNALYREYVANLNTAYRIKDKKARTDTINALRTQYNETVKEVNKLSMAANLNLTRQRLERLEFGLAQKDPKQDCTTNPKTSKTTCRTIGYTTVQVMGGLNFLNANDSPIIAPEDAIDMSELENLMSSTTASND